MRNASQKSENTYRNPLYPKQLETPEPSVAVPTHWYGTKYLTCIAIVAFEIPCFLTNTHFWIFFRSGKYQPNTKYQLVEA